MLRSSPQSPTESAHAASLTSWRVGLIQCFPSVECFAVSLSDDPRVGLVAETNGGAVYYSSLVHRDPGVQLGASEPGGATAADVTSIEVSRGSRAHRKSREVAATRADRRCRQEDAALGRPLIVQPSPKASSRPASCHAFMPPSRSVMLVNPASTSNAEASALMLPLRQYSAIGASGSSGRAGSPTISS